MAQMNLSNLKPNDFRDFLSFASFFSFMAIFLNYSLGNETLSNLIVPIFLVIGGMGLLIVGKVFKIGKWISDGIQEEETVRIFVIVFGFSSLLIGALLFANVELSEAILGYAGFVAFASAIYVLIDYVAKNVGGNL